MYKNLIKAIEDDSKLQKIKTEAPDLYKYIVDYEARIIRK